MIKALESNIHQGEQVSITQDKNKESIRKK